MKSIQVAVGIVIDADKHVFVTKRAPEAHEGDKWEFPGGKVESGESLLEGLSRELKEEIGLQNTRSQLWQTLSHSYPTKIVHLSFFWVYAERDQVYGAESQEVQWLAPEQLSKLEMPAANHSLLPALQKELLTLNLSQLI